MIKAASILLSVCLFLFVVTISIQYFRIVKASVDVPSIINSDTIWTQSNSPYELKGPVLINEGVTLTIEPGTTVNLNNYYMQVNGTLKAKGTDTNLINLNDGTISFTDSSTNWNEQTGSGCIIENSNLISSRINISNSPKINKNIIREIHVDGSPIIIENVISGQVGISGSPTIANNSITNRAPFGVSIGGSPLILDNTIDCRIYVTSGSPKMSGNTIGDGIHVDSHGGIVEIKNNIVNSRGDYYSIFVHGSSATISGNNITGKGNMGIYLSGPYNFFIANNTITNCATAITANNPCPLTIERNHIFNNIDGVSVTISESVFAPFEQKWKSPSDFPFIVQNNFISDNSGFGISINHPLATIMNNSISGNHVGIIIRDLSGYLPLPVILNNNIYANEYNLKSEFSDNVNATNNWWGTTDISTINQTIYDSKYDFNVGTINFVPILTAANPEIPEFPSWTLLLIMMVTFATVTIIYKRKLQN